MNHTVYVWMRLEDLVKVLLFSDINIEELWSSPADELNAIDGLF